MALELRCWIANIRQEYIFLDLSSYLQQKISLNGSRYKFNIPA